MKMEHTDSRVSTRLRYCTVPYCTLLCCFVLYRTHLLREASDDGFVSALLHRFPPAELPLHARKLRLESVPGVSGGNAIKSRQGRVSVSFGFLAEIQQLSTTSDRCRETGRSWRTAAESAHCWCAPTCTSVIGWSIACTRYRLAEDKATNKRLRSADSESLALR